MSGKRPATTSRQLRRILVRDGWVIQSQTGSHVKLTRSDGSGRVIVPNHPGDVNPGTLRGILRQAEMSPKRFIELRSE
jgi:predicted RNA binding protein YcfA (HicA-like mRNA interferase family)